MVGLRGVQTEEISLGGDIFPVGADVLPLFDEAPVVQPVVVPDVPLVVIVEPCGKLGCLLSITNLG